MLIPDWLSQPCSFGFLSSDASVCTTMAFPLVGDSAHVVVSVSIDFPSNSKWDALFHCIAYDYSRADRNGLCDHLGVVPWEDIFKLSAFAAIDEFYELVQLGIDVYIPHGKYHNPLNFLKWLAAYFCQRRKFSGWQD